MLETYISELPRRVLKPALREERIRLDEIARAVIRGVLRDVHGGALGDIVARHAVSSMGGHPREARWDRGIVTQRLLQDRNRVFELLYRSESDLVRGHETLSDLGREFLVDGWVLQDEERHAGEEGGGCFTAGGQECLRVGHHFRLGQRLLADALVLEHCGEEVVARCFALQSLVDLRCDGLAEGNARSEGGGVIFEQGDETVVEGDDGVLSAHGHQAGCLKGTQDELDPWVVTAVAEAVQWLAESEVCNDVEGGVIVPGHDIGGFFAFLDALIQTLDEEVLVASTKSAIATTS